MKDNQEFIKGIYQKFEEYQKEEKEHFKPVKNILEIEKNKYKKVWMKITSVAAVIVLLFSFILVNDKTRQLVDNKLLSKKSSYTVEENPLTKVGDFETFYKLIKENSSKFRSSETTMVQEEMALDDTTKGETNSAQNADNKEKAEYSTTNNQVKDVEESDIVKTDGRYIYHVLEKGISIVDAQVPENLKEVSRIDFTGKDIRPNEIYLYENQLIVLANNYSYDYVLYDVMTKSTSGTENKNKAMAMIYDIKDIENPKEIRTIKVEGNYLSSRLIDGSLYFISTQYINSYAIAKNEIEELKAEDFQPTYCDSILGEEDKQIDFDHINYLNDVQEMNYLNLVGINLKEEKEADIKTFLGVGEEIYCSEQNLYIIKNNMKYNSITREMKDSTTSILKFKLEKGKMEYKAEGEVPGYINNQFSMDESNNTFKIATTSGIQWNLTDTTTNGLYVLDENLKVIGKLEGLAKGEKIYSVRYTDKKAYIVTFKEMDPLFVINLSDPRNPKVEGELKIPGYSTYLHPYDDNHLIGFGYDVKEDGTRNISNGLKVSLFDISDYSNPKEMFKVEIGDRYTSSLLNYDHKALLFSNEKNIIAFPISHYQRGEEIHKAMIYQIDLEKGFQLKGEILSSRSNYQHQIERILYIKDYFYTVSKAELQAVKMESFEVVDRLKY